MTITIDSELFKGARREADRRGITLKDYIEGVLDTALQFPDGIEMPRIAIDQAQLEIIRHAYNCGRKHAKAELADEYFQLVTAFDEHLWRLREKFWAMERQLITIRDNVEKTKNDDWKNFRKKYLKDTKITLRDLKLR